jgi:hypothetical protein
LADLEKRDFEEFKREGDPLKVTEARYQYYLEKRRVKAQVLKRIL